MKRNPVEMFDGTSLAAGLVFLGRKRRSRGVYWSIFAPALILPHVGEFLYESGCRLGYFTHSMEGWRIGVRLRWPGNCPD